MRELYLVPGKVHKMKTLSLRPALFGKSNCFEHESFKYIRVPPYLKVKVFLPF